MPRPSTAFREREIDPRSDSEYPEAKGVLERMQRDKVGEVKTKGGDYPVFKKKSDSANEFNAQFKEARAMGRETFTFHGREYHTRLASEDEETWKDRMKSRRKKS